MAEAMNLELDKNCVAAGKKKNKTKKKQQLHPTATIEALAGDWIDVTSSSAMVVTLHAYKLCFHKNAAPPGVEKDRYADFALLFDAAVDDDVLNTEIPLHLTKSTKVSARISACGTYSLTSEQLEQAKAYHQLTFNCLFGKPNDSSRWCRKKSGESSSSRIQQQQLQVMNAEEEDSWSKKQMYLLLPLLPDDIAIVNGHGSRCAVVSIDWEAIKNTAMAANMLSDILLDETARKDHRSRCLNVVVDAESDDYVYMACGLRACDALRGTAVVTVHTGRMYIVVDVSTNMNAECIMDGPERASMAIDIDNNTKNRSGRSYTDYFAEKYGIMLKHRRRPLLQAKQPHKLRNLLAMISDTNSEKKEKKSNFVQIPPELCLPTGITKEMINSLYLFPSMMHRFKALILACQLRSKIAKEMPHCSHVDPALVMEALTTVRCLEGFSSEGLELLGDSFLKYAVSKYLYLMYNTKQEGQLTARRSRLICNENLHRLAMKKGLPEYIRDEPFQTDSWRAPGTVDCAKSSPCKCNLESLQTTATLHLQDTENRDQCQGVEEEEDGELIIEIGRNCSEGQEDEDLDGELVTKIGKSCCKGHRWICWKTVADTVEALIGAFLVSGGPAVATCFIKWIGVEVDFDYKSEMQEEEEEERSQMARNLNEMRDIRGLEAQLGYVFRNRTLLVQALTHGSSQDPVAGGVSCYQRLEFLGDAVLDFLITNHLFLAHPGLSPGALSDLRSAAVNNECFARATVKHGLHKYLCHGSSELLSDIRDFVAANQAARDQVLFGWEGIEGPKVLGDLIESIAGAVLVDCGFNLETVWRVMQPLLSPLVTPATLPLHPVREVVELCQHRRIPFLWRKFGKNGSLSTAEARVTINGDEVYTLIGSGRANKIAKKNAAQQILSLLLSKGIVHPRTTQEPATATTKPRKHASDEETEGSCNSIDVVATSFPRDMVGTSTDVRRSKEDNVTMIPTKRYLSGGGAAAKRTNYNSNPILQTNNDVRDDDSTVVASPEKQRLRACDKERKRNAKKRRKCKSKTSKIETKRWTDSAENTMSPDSSLTIRPDDENTVGDTSRLWSQQKMFKVLPDSPLSSLPSTPAAPFKTERQCDISDGQSSVPQSPLKTMAELRNSENNAGSEESKRLKQASADLQKYVGGRSDMEKGRARSLLNEFCMRNKWTMPDYAEVGVQDGIGGLFVFSARINGGCAGVIRRRGDPMPTKHQAKDNVAAKILTALYNAFSV